MIDRRAFTLALCTLAVAGCKKPYRVGDYVWVEWDGRNYPAYILEVKSRTRFRVHFDGYAERWDTDVTLERIKGRVEGEPTPPPPPPKVARVRGVSPKASSSAAPVSPYRVGDRVKVKWRGSVYSATVLEVKSPTELRIHYDGHEDAWDETVGIERILGRR